MVTGAVKVVVALTVNASEAASPNILLLPNALKLFESVVIPVTARVEPRVVAPPTLSCDAIPAPPDTTNAPVFVAVESVVLETVAIPVTPRVELKVVAPVTFNVEVKVDAPVIVAAPPTLSCLAIPTPPVTITAPVVVDVESVALLVTICPILSSLAVFDAILNLNGDVPSLSIETLPLKMVLPL